MLASPKKRIVELLNKYPEFSSILLVLCANIFNSLITFVVSIFLAKNFGPENFGIFSLAITIMMMVSIIFDVGLNLSLVRFFNLYQKDRERQKLLISSLFIFKICIIMLLIGISIPAGALLTKLLHLNVPYESLFPLAIISGGAFALWVYYQNYQQAHRNFPKLSFYIFGYGSLRILFIGLLLALYGSDLKITTAFMSLYTLPVVVIILMAIIPIIRQIFIVKALKPSVILSILKETIKYGKWVAVASIFYNLILRSTQLILAFRASKYELGILSAGFVFTLAFSSLNTAVRTVFFPHVTALERIKDMKNHMARISKNFPYYAISAAIIIIILAFVQIAFLGDKYIQALPVFLITSVALALTVFMGLITMLLHTLMRPEIFAIINILRLVSSCFIVYFLSPIYGALGGAIAYAFSLIAGELFMIFFIRRTINEQPQD